MELDLQGVRLEKSPEIDGLIKEVKKLVKEYRKEQNKLLDGQES